MVRRFVDRWNKPKNESITSKIANVAKPSENIKDQIAQVTQRLDIQTKTLDNAVSRFQNRDAAIFSRVVKAMEQRDEARANIFATELAEIRKVEKMLSNASLALQSVSMRLNTVSELGDLVTVLAPAKNLLSNVSVNNITASADALQILEEAEFAAENRIRERLPEVSNEKTAQKRSPLEA